jgi:flotillin
VFTGRGGFRLVRGGATFRLPVIERVDYMSLAPFEVELPIRGAYSKEGVPVHVDAVALVRFDSTEEAVRTAAERFLNSDRSQLQASVQQILAGHLRSICAKMTVEELNSSREAFVSRVTDEAGSDFGGIGMNLDVLTIQHISDDQGYLENLGRKRVAEVKRDAQIGEAEAQRDAMVRAAEARRLGETAEAEAAAAIAEATRDRDLRIAEARRRELEAEGEGEAKARTVKAEAHRLELEAEGAGQKAILLGEAEGKEKLAEALNQYNQAALQLAVYPELIEKLPEIAQSLASPFAQVDRIVLMDSGNGSNGSGSLSKYGSAVPMMLAQAIETLRAVGLDLPALLKQEEDSGANGHSPAVSEEARAAIEQLAADAEVRKDGE